MREPPVRSTENVPEPQMTEKPPRLPTIREEGSHGAALLVLLAFFTIARNSGLTKNAINKIAAISKRTGLSAPFKLL